MARIFELDGNRGDRPAHKRRISGMHDWYFDGYERVEYIDKKGKTRTRLEYYGKYYCLCLDGEALRQLRRRYILVAIPYIILTVIGVLLMGSLAQAPPGAIFAINMVAMYYFGLGLFHLLRLKEEFNHRALYRSIRRMETGVWGLMVLTALSFIFALVCLIFQGHKLDLQNFIFLCCSAGNTALSGVLMWLVNQSRYKVTRECSKPEDVEDSEAVEEDL